MSGSPDHLDLGRADAYGRSFGDVYDRWYRGVTDAEATADFVVARHPRSAGPVLEVGVGTGRLAVPLARRGLAVIGLDGSAEMLARCHRGPVPGVVGPGIHPVLADMRALPFAPDVGFFGTVLLAFNTLFNLTTDAEQATLLDDLARLVDRRGSVIVEMLDVSALLDGPDRSVGRREDSGDPVVITATALDRDHQRLWGQHLEIADDGVTVRPWMLRWVTPEQLDAMAVDAGLTLAERFGSWTGAPVSPHSPTVISRYRPAR